MDKQKAGGLSDKENHCFCNGKITKNTIKSHYRVSTQIICRPICNANTLNPTIGTLNLGIPTVSSIMGHLIGKVLPKS